MTLNEVTCTNTTGEVPEEWYREENHIGYSLLGLKLNRQIKTDSLDSFLEKLDRSNGWRQLIDTKLGAGIHLSSSEVKFVRNLSSGLFLKDGFTEGVPMAVLKNENTLDEPKRRFVASRWESKRVLNILRSLRSLSTSMENKEIPLDLLIWSGVDKTVNSERRELRAPRSKPGGHDESYNAPLEYKSDVHALSKGILRQVPAYKHFLKEQFGRCLDLYLCPRIQKTKMSVKVSDLFQNFKTSDVIPPFPSKLMMKFVGHENAIISIDIHPSGNLLATSSSDSSVRIWNLCTAKCLHTIELSTSAFCVKWCPRKDLFFISICVSCIAYFINLTNTLKSRLKDRSTTTKVDYEHLLRDVVNIDSNKSSRWTYSSRTASHIMNPFHLNNISWHHKGDFVCTSGSKISEICVHQVSTKISQRLFIEGNKTISKTMFHPLKPYLLIASKEHIIVYDLKVQQIFRKFAFEFTRVTTMDLHPSGEHFLVGCENGKLYWYNIELSSEPERSISFSKSVVSLSFHRIYPLFLLELSDSSVQIFSCFVIGLLSGVSIQPLKTIRESSLEIFQESHQSVFHSTQPWLFRTGINYEVLLYSEV